MPTLLFAVTACAQGPSVVLHPPGGDVSVRVEVVNKPSTREQGLMYRRELAADAGMLFVFPKAEKLRFWMKNTIISLDMIFIDNSRHVVGVVANAKPMTTDGLGVDQPSLYVLEVNAGFAAKHGIAAGTVVEFVNVPEGAT